MRDVSEKTTKKIEFVIQNWEKMSIIELSQKLEVPPMTISQWAARLRHKGIHLTPRNKISQINWKYLQEKYAHKENTILTDLGDISKEEVEYYKGKS